MATRRTGRGAMDCKQQRGGEEKEEQLGGLKLVVIVGAGPSGIALMRRLCVRRDVGRVIVLEKGPGVTGVTGDEAEDASQWARAAYEGEGLVYETVPQAGLTWNRVVQVPQGTGVGGSGRVNAMVYTRGMREQFASWPRAWREGLERSCDAVETEWLLPALKHARGVGKRQCDALSHMVSGRGPERQCEMDGLSSARAVGWDRENTGYSAVMALAEDGKRMPLFRKAMDSLDEDEQDKVDLIPHAQVTRILFAGGNGAEAGSLRAVGLEYVLANDATGTVQRIKLSSGARGEIVLCCGAIETPKLLMLSGVGPAEHLQSLGVPVHLANDAVGAELVDHVGVPVIRHCDRALYTRSCTETCVHGWVHMTAPKTGQHLQVLLMDGQCALVLLPRLLLPHCPQHRLYSFLRSVFLWILMQGLLYIPFLASWLESCFASTVCLMDPRSRGTVRLRSTDPDDSPLLDPGYCSHPDDLATLSWGLHQTRLTSSDSDSGSEQLLRLARQGSREMLPGPLFAYCTTDRLRRLFVRAMMSTYFHLSGSVGIGRAVDDHLRICPALRVCDASVFPEPVWANPCATCFALGDRLGEIMD